MADREWLHNLASARFRDGQLTPADPDAVHRLAAARIEDTMVQLYQEALEACDAFNALAPSERHVRLLPLSPSPPATGGGLMLLLGMQSVRLQHMGQQLVATLTRVAGFTSSVDVIATYHPQVDRFGTLVWRDDKSLLLHHELIMKQCFAALVEAEKQASRDVPDPPSGGGSRDVRRRRASR